MQIIQLMTNDEKTLFILFLVLIMLEGPDPEGENYWYNIKYK